MFVQYAAVFFIVAGVMTAMSVFIRRAVQARIYAAHHYAYDQINEVFANPAYNFQGNHWAQYEPYYTNTDTIRSFAQETITTTEPGGRDGIVTYEMPAPENVSRSRTTRVQDSAASAD